MFSEAALVSFIATLFSMTNPVGNLGIFSSMTEGRSAAEIKRTAWICGGAVGVILLLMAWSGTMLMKFFGISVDSLRAAGGVIVLIIGLHMLFNKSEHKQSSAESKDAKSRPSIAVVPLAIPIVGGPGAMIAVLVASQQDPSILNRIEISIIILSFSVLISLLFSLAKPLSKWLGESGMGVVTRVMGLILATIAMGMLTEGLKELLPGLAG